MYRTPAAGFAAALLTLTGATTGGLATAAPALADDTVIAIDVRPAPGTQPAALIGIDATRPRTLTVTGHEGRPVTLSAKGTRPRTITVAAGKPAVFTRLVPGKAYTITIGGRRVGTAIPVTAPTPATGLTVATTAVPGTVRLAWQHTPTAAQGPITYIVTARPIGVLPVGLSPDPITIESTEPAATLTGLDLNTLYEFTVTARNSTATGPASTATMTRPLAGLGIAVPAPTSAPAPAPTPAPAPAPAPAAPPAPAQQWRTEWFCSEGYTLEDRTCSNQIPYTYSTQTLPYTYHSEQQLSTISVPATHNGTIWTWSCPSGYSDGGGQWGVGVCKGTVTVQVKDATPSGYTDNGTAWTRQVKDTTPSGYTDNGTAWVITQPASSRQVPA
jgi:hypothetical protein